MASIFDMFRKQEPAAPATNNSANNNNTVPNNNNTPANNNNDATVVTDPNNTNAPLAKFEKLWENDDTKKGVPDTFTMDADPAKLMEAAKQVDFTKFVSPELRERVQAGGADANAALMEAMNTVTQASFAQASFASTKIAEQAVQAAEKRFAEMLPGIIRQQQVADTMRASDNPLLSNPVFSPMVDALRDQMTRKFPNVSAAEIKSYVDDYLQGAAQALNSNKQQEPATKGRVETDWSKFLGQ